MSANNQVYIQEIDGKYHAWEMMAEPWDKGVPTISVTDPHIIADTWQEAVDKAYKDAIIVEYGVTNLPIFLKSGTRFNVLDANGEVVNEFQG